MARIEEEEVRHIAMLSRLELQKEELPFLIKHFNEILDYFDKLKEVDCEGVPPFESFLVEDPSLREDITVLWPCRDEVLDAAPHREGDYFRVPRIVEDIT